MTGALQTRDQVAAAYLHHVQELAMEISAATEAIETNALLRFQESVAKQEMLCAGLAAMGKSGGDTPYVSPQSRPQSPESEIELKIQAAVAALRELNLKYAALLRHSGKSIALLSLLCKSHMGTFQEGRGPQLKQQTWSCEA